MNFAALRLLPLFVGLATAAIAAADPASAGGWKAGWPREEIRPQFQFEPQGGPDKTGSWAIAADARPGLAGYWSRTFPVQGGHFYHFTALRKTAGVELPRRATLVQIFWEDAQGQAVPYGDRGAFSYVPRGLFPVAEPEYPSEGSPGPSGWAALSDTYPAPPRAVRATVKLHYRWQAAGRVEWSRIALEETAPPAPRLARLATVNFRPEGGTTPAEKREQFAPFIAQAAAQKADLVVLPETLTIFGSHPDYQAAAEPIPGGPSCAYFGSLAKRYNLYIVAGLVEREGHLVYNTAVLMGPDGQFVGKYRKVTLPRGEVDAGVTPGREYPVFATRFGKVGIMICYDAFFPEVARNLSDRGAEVIAWPVWGFNPMLAAARACENGVYLVSSTYDKWDWRIDGASPGRGYDDREISGVYDWEGRVLAGTSEPGAIAIATVDLNARLHWGVLGDFKAELVHSRPAWSTDPAE